MKTFATEQAIYGVVLVAGLLVVTADKADAFWDVFVKVLITVLIFWAVHVYAGTIAHLGDALDAGVPPMARISKAVHVAVEHSWGMLLAVVPPLLVLVIGHPWFLDDTGAVWVALWLCVALLGVLGYGKVAVWTTDQRARLLGGAATGALGLLMVSLKALVH
ncbi:hypothetical protein [Micropruina sp.]|uniref:hypothetical protein n=1 Tax=Micropruina sp. TaxID=2737536 RepID=UPI0039E34076